MFTIRDTEDGRSLWIDVYDDGMLMPPPWQMVVPVREATVANVMAALLPHVAAAVNKAQPDAPALEWEINGLRKEARFERNGYIFAICPDPFHSGDDVAELRQELKGDFQTEQLMVRYRLNNGSDMHWLNPQQADFPPVEKVIQLLAMEVFKSLLK